MTDAPATTAAQATPASVEASVLEREIAVEQRHVDRVYARLAELRAAATRAEREGYEIAGVGTYGVAGGARRDGLPRRAAAARAGHRARGAGLRPARPARRAGAVRRPAGRTRPRAPSRWSSTGARPPRPPFYQATAAEPRGVVRRRMIQSSGEKVTGISDDLLDPARRAVRHGDGRRRRAAGRAVPGQDRRDARHRRHHPARAGRGDPLPRLRGHDRVPADPAPARPRSRCTGRRTCSTPTATGSPAAASWSSARRRSSSTTSPPCCPRSARRRPRCARSARWWRGSPPTGSTRPRWRR